MGKAQIFIFHHKLYQICLEVHFLKSFPLPLTASEEQYYLQKYIEGDLNAKHILIEHNLRLVAHVVKKYQGSDVDLDDLISIGTIGLIKGISTFKPDKKVRLATYASRCVENEILMHFRSQRKYQGDVSLSDSIDSDREGTVKEIKVSTGDSVLEGDVLLTIE